MGNCEKLARAEAMRVAPSCSLQLGLPLMQSTNSLCFVKPTYFTNVFATTNNNHGFMVGNALKGWGRAGTQDKVLCPVYLPVFVPLVHCPP